MSRVWATGREPFGLMPVSAAKVAISSATINHVSQVTPILLAHTLPFDEAMACLCVVTGFRNSAEHELCDGFELTVARSFRRFEPLWWRTTARFRANPGGDATSRRVHTEYMGNGSPAPRSAGPAIRQRMTKYTHGEPISRYTARKAKVMSAPSL